MQALLPAIYPMLKSGFALSFGQIGLLTLIFQVTASLLQPMVGLYTDRRPQPYSLPLGMACSLLGMVTLAFAPNFPALLAGAALLGIGSSIFHPKSSRLARLASGGAHGFAQSFFQVGGHVGSALGPLLAAFVVLPQGRGSLAWFALAALLGICILGVVGRWYKGAVRSRATKPEQSAHHITLPPTLVRRAMAVLIALDLFQILLFGEHYQLLHLLFDAPLRIVDRDGSNLSVCFSCCIRGRLTGRRAPWRQVWSQEGHLGLDSRGAALHARFAVRRPDRHPHSQHFHWADFVVRLFGNRCLWSGADAGPGRHGFGTFLWLAFGMGGIGAAVLGELADWTSIEFVYRVCSFLPLIGLLALFLPNRRRSARVLMNFNPQQTLRNNHLFFGFFLCGCCEIPLGP